MILLPLRSTSNKPWQNAITKHPPIKPSRTARKAVSQPTSIWQPTLQANTCRVCNEALCAVPASRRMRAAFFAYFFLLSKKSRSPKASKATHQEAEPNALRKSVPHFSFIPDGRQDTDNLKANWHKTSGQRFGGRSTLSPGPKVRSERREGHPIPNLSVVGKTSRL